MNKQVVYVPIETRTIKLTTTSNLLSVYHTPFLRKSWCLDMQHTLHVWPSHSLIGRMKYLTSYRNITWSIYRNLCSLTLQQRFPSGEDTRDDDPIREQEVITNTKRNILCHILTWKDKGVKDYNHGLESILSASDLNRKQVGSHLIHWQNTLNLNLEIINKLSV